MFLKNYICQTSILIYVMVLQKGNSGGMDFMLEIFVDVNIEMMEVNGWMMKLIKKMKYFYQSVGLGQESIQEQWWSPECVTGVASLHFFGAHKNKIWNTRTIIGM